MHLVLSMSESCSGSFPTPALMYGNLYYITEVVNTHYIKRICIKWYLLHIRTGKEHYFPRISNHMSSTSSPVKVTLQ